MKPLFLFLFTAALLNQGIARQGDSLRVADSLETRWSVHRITKEEIRHFPFRGLEQYLPLLPGVVQVNSEFHLRGSRPYETGYSVDHFNVSNPFFGNNGVSLIPEAIERVDVHTGAYGAELGSFGGGMVVTTMRTGGEKLEYFLDVQTDDVVHPGGRFLNTTPQGYKNFVGTVGGPLPVPPVDAKFFVVGQHTYLRNRQSMFLEPFRYDSLTDDGYWRSSNLGRPLPGPVEFTQSWLPDNWFKATTLQGNITAGYEGLHVKILASYDEREQPVGSEWPNALIGYFNQQRNMLNKTTTKFGAGEIRYDFSDRFTAKMAVCLYDRYERTFDRNLGHNWFSYPDSAANAKYYNTTQWLGRYTGPDVYSTIFAFRFNALNTPNNTYSKNRQTNLGLSLNLDIRPSEMFELKVGGKVDSWKMRMFSVGSIANLRRFLDQTLDGVNDAVFASPFEERIRYLQRGMIETYGYTYTGVETDGYTLDGAPWGANLDKPYKPLFGSLYTSATLKSTDLELEAGIRYEYFEPNFKTLDKTLNPSTGVFDWGDDYGNIDYNVALGIIDESKLKDIEAVGLFLPRLSIRFTLDDKTTFFAAYGRFAQMPRLDFLSMSSYKFSQGFAPDTRSPFGGGLAFEVRPEQSTHFEFGARRRVLPSVVVGASVYRKSLMGQVQLDQALTSAGDPVFTLYRNNGQGVSRGIELEFELMRTAGLAVKAQGAFSVSEGYTSNPSSNARQVSDSPLPVNPKATYPYDYDQAKRGTAIVSYRIEDESDPVFDEFDVTGVFSFSTGHPFTRESENLLLSGGPWNVGVPSIRDVRLSTPLEPLNSSRLPSTFVFDLRISKAIRISPVTVTLYLNILNVLNTRNVLNVYPATGSANDDAWLNHVYEAFYESIPNYESFYRDINLKNRWAYMSAAGNDLYGSPRQIQFGLRVEM